MGKKTELVGNVQEITDFYHNITEANKESWHTSHSQLHLPSITCQYGYV